VLLEDGGDFQEEIGLEEDLVRTVVGPGADQTCAFAVAELVGDLFDGGLLWSSGNAVWPAEGEVPGKT